MKKTIMAREDVNSKVIIINEHQENIHTYTARAWKVILKMTNPTSSKHHHQQETCILYLEDKLY